MRHRLPGVDRIRIRSRASQSLAVARAAAEQSSPAPPAKRPAHASVSAQASASVGARSCTADVLAHADPVGAPTPHRRHHRVMFLRRAFRVHDGVGDVGRRHVHGAGLYRDAFPARAPSLARGGGVLAELVRKRRALARSRSSRRRSHLAMSRGLPLWAAAALDKSRVAGARAFRSLRSRAVFAAAVVGRDAPSARTAGARCYVAAGGREVFMAERLPGRPEHGFVASGLGAPKPAARRRVATRRAQSVRCRGVKAPACTHARWRPDACCSSSGFSRARASQEEPRDAARRSTENANDSCQVSGWLKARKCTAAATAAGSAAVRRSPAVTAAAAAASRRRRARRRRRCGPGGGAGGRRERRRRERRRGASSQHSPPKSKSTEGITSIPLDPIL